MTTELATQMSEAARRAVTWSGRASSPLSSHPARRVYRVDEYGEVPIPITELFAGGELDVYPEGPGRYYTIQAAKGRLHVKAGGYVGLIPVNDRVVLDVRPRVPVDNLERMLDLAERSPRPLHLLDRGYVEHERQIPSLIDMLTDALLEAILEIEAQGLHRDYLQRIEDTNFPRGRILLNETIQRYAGRENHHRVVVSWYEQSTDTGPNRCLKYALWYLAQLYSRMEATSKNRERLFRLNRAYNLFDSVELDLTKSFQEDELVAHPEELPALRAYYNRALSTALTIIRERGVSLDEREGETQLPTLLIDLDKTFENYLRAVLHELLRVQAPHIRVLDGNETGIGGGGKRLFDVGGEETAQPDIVFKSPQTTYGMTKYPLLAEVKYKPVYRPKREDIEQAITYGVSYRAPNVVIVQPCFPGSSRGLDLVGSVQALRVYQYLFNLAADNPEAEEASFANAMLQLVSS